MLIIINSMSKQFQHKKVSAVSIGHLFNDIFASFLSPVIPVLIEKLGISVSMAGLLDIIRNTPSILNPFVAYFIERLRSKIFCYFHARCYFNNNESSWNCSQLRDCGLS